MKKLLLSQTRNGAFVILVALCILFCQPVFAQDFTANVVVNDITAGDQNTDGARLIAALGDSVYVVWADEDSSTFYFSKSTDGGATFLSAVHVSSIPDTVSQLFPSMVVDNSGVIYIAWSVLSSDMSVSYGIWFTKSTDGGASFESAVQVNNFGVFPDIAVYGSDVYIMFADASNYPLADYFFSRSINGGDDFEPSYRINDVNCAAPIHEFESLLSLCVDRDGNIYAVWNDGRRPEGNNDIYFAKSTNGGVSFGEDVPVNDITISAGDSVQFSPFIAVGGTGAVYVVWTDMREGFDDDGARVYFSMSTNGGGSFGPDSMVGEPTSSSRAEIVASSGLVVISWQGMSSTQGNGIWTVMSSDGCSGFSSPVAVTDEFNYAASYPSMFLDENQKVYVVWADERQGDKDIYFSRVTIRTGIVENNVSEVPDDYLLYQNYPNPFNSSTNILYSIPRSGFVTLTIYDILGREIQTLVSEFQKANTYSVNIDAGKLSSGVYFYKLQLGDLIETKKMLLIR
jgi:hypothetical protein